MHKRAVIVMTLCACFISLFLLSAGIPGGIPVSQAAAIDDEAAPRQKRGGLKPATPPPAASHSLFAPSSAGKASKPLQAQPVDNAVPAVTSGSQLPAVQPEVQPQSVPDNYFAPTGAATQSRPQPLVAPTTAPAANAPADNYFVPAAAATHPAAAPHTAVQPKPQPALSRPQPPAAKRTGVKGGDVSFNFDDADVFSVIQTIFGDVLKVNYIVDPNVKGRVNFRSVAPVAKDDVMPLMEVILRLNGIGIVEEGGLYRIIPIADLPKEPAPVSIGREAEKVRITGKALVQVVPVLYNQSGELTRVLTPFLSKSAVIIDVPKSNYLIIVDTDANVKRLLQLVEIFDSEQLKQVTPQVFVYPVQNSKAKDLAAIIQQIFLGARPATQAARPATQRPGTPAQPAAQPIAQPQVLTGQSTGTGDILVAESTRIIPDEITNSIVVLSTAEDYLIIHDTLQKIDVVPRQVMIEGLIVQVRLRDNLSFGMSWSVNTDFNITGIKPFTNAVNLSGDVNINSPSTAATNLPAKGFTFVGKDPTGTVRAVLTTLAEESKAKVLASPHLLVSDNREARMQVGSQVPLTTSQTSTTAATGTVPSITSTVQYKDIGIILKVKPQVNDSGLIFLELSQEISSIGEVTVDVGGLRNITIDKIEATSNLVAKDGETIIIGGLIREDTSKSKDGIPLLNKIPLIGSLFGNTTDDVTRTELIILLTPHVMRNLQEAGDVTTNYLDRYKGYSKDKGIEEFIQDRGRIIKDSKDMESSRDGMPAEKKGEDK